MGATLWLNDQGCEATLDAKGNAAITQLNIAAVLPRLCLGLYGRTVAILRSRGKGPLYGLC
jgi:hypothetical protein